MKIVLVSPKGPLYRRRGGIFSRSLRYKPLTLTTLAALVPAELDAEIVIVDEGIQDVDTSIDADVVGITVITGTAPRAYEIAARFRERGITVVLGGPHITLIPDDAAPHADALVVGYAEDTWPQLLRDFAARRLRARYDQAPNLSLAGRPFARRDLLPSREYITDNVFEATRGCVHTCDFCVVPSAWGTTPYQKPVEEIVAEIRQKGARKLIFVDLNIIADRAYAARLFEALIPLRVQWYGLATVLLADDPTLVALAARSGCRGLLIGLESISPANLSASHKGFNRPERFREIVETLHRHRISLQGAFVFGLDHDTPDVFLKTARLAVEARIDLPRFAVVTPFPGTTLYRRLEREGRILTRNWELYDGQHVVFQPAQMSVQELQMGIEKAWRYSYSVPSMLRRFSSTPSPFSVWLGANLGYRFYAHNLRRFYNCDWIVGGRSRPAA
jgi:radical SAM superfamily enzyme YgiQ (UPF0313 family)